MIQLSLLEWISIEGVLRAEIMIMNKSTRAHATTAILEESGLGDHHSKIYFEEEISLVMGRLCYK